MRIRTIGMVCMGLAAVLGIAVMLGVLKKTLGAPGNGPNGFAALAPDSSSGVSDIETFLDAWSGRCA